MKRLLAFLLWSSLALAQQVLMPFPRQQFLDNNGKPLAGGCVSTYQSGTSTPLQTYTDSTGVTLNPNPVILDSGGSGNIWLKPGTAYRIKVSTAGSPCGVQQYLVDGVVGNASSPIITGQAQTTVAFSTTPTFTTLATTQLFKMTLTGNVVSSVVAMGIQPVPSIVTFELTEDNAGSRTFAWPANAVGGQVISLTANTTTSQTFVWDGLNLVAVGSARVSDGTALWGDTNGNLGKNSITLYSLNGGFWVDSNKYATVQAAITAATPPAIITVPCGSFVGPTTWKSNITILSSCGNAISNAYTSLWGLQPGGSFQAQSGTVFTYAANLVFTQLQNIGLTNVTLDFASSNAGVVLTSVSYFNWTDVLIDRCGGVPAPCLALNNTGVGAANNTALNTFTRLRINGSPNPFAQTVTGITFNGTLSTGPGVVLNHFSDLNIGGALIVGIDFIQACDTNWFEKVLINSSIAGAQGMRFNPVVPAVDHDANSNQILGYSCASNCTVPSISFGQSSGNYILAQGNPNTPNTLGGAPTYTVIWTGATSGATGNPAQYNGTNYRFADGINLGPNGITLSQGANPPTPFISGLSPTISSGFCTSPSVLVANGTAAFRVGVGSACGTGSGVVLMPLTATTGWNCMVNNRSAKSAHRADNAVQTASSTTTVTIEEQTLSTGANTNFASNDGIDLNCLAF